MQRFLDPYLFLGIILLLIYRYSGVWLKISFLDQYLRAIILEFNWLLGLGAIFSLLVGSIRPIVRALFQRQFLAAAFFYATFWFVLSIPAFYLSVAENNTTASTLYWGSLLVFFLLTNVLIAISYTVCRLFPNMK